MPRQLHYGVVAFADRGLDLVEADLHRYDGGRRLRGRSWRRYRGGTARCCLGRVHLLRCVEGKLGENGHREWARSVVS